MSMKFNQLPKTIRDKRKVNYTIALISLILFIAEVFRFQSLRFDVLGILMLFFTAYFNTDGKVQMSFSDEDVELQKHKSSEVKDRHSFICAILTAALNVLTVIIYFVR